MFIGIKLSKPFLSHVAYSFGVLGWIMFLISSCLITQTDVSILYLIGSLFVVTDCFFILHFWATQKSKKLRGTQIAQNVVQLCQTTLPG